MNDNLKFVVIGHRGCSGIEPENTLRGVKGAIELGCQMIEIDVHVSEGELIVIHDERVDRTSDGTGKLSDYSLAELRKMDVGFGERIPLLEEVLDLCLGSVRLNIELKGKGTAAKVVALLRRRELKDTVLISSFDWDQLNEVRSLSDLPIAVLVKNKIEVSKSLVLAKKLQAEMINFHIKIADRELVERVHQAHFLAAFYTVKSTEEAQKLIDLGADACFVDDPRMVMALL